VIEKTGKKRLIDKENNMSDIQKKLEDYLDEETLDEYLPDDDVKMMDRMIEFIMDLETESLSEDQIDEVTDLIDLVSDGNIDEIFDDDEIDEAVAAKKVKIKASDKRKRRIEYRRNRAAIKMKAKKFRRTTKFKQWKRLKKRKASSGKTARGKRIRKFL
jgi:Na+/phosphate symporter